MMHSGRRLLTSGIRLLCLRQQRLLSVSNHVVKSSLSDVEIPNISLPDYVWKRLDQWPEKVAVECGVTGRRYRYAEMRELCRRFAASLRRAGLQRGDTLTIVMPNTAEWPIVLLGAMEAGLVVSTANPHYTAGEITRQLGDCQPKAIVTLSAILPTVQEAITLAGTQTKPLIVIAPGLETTSDIPAGTVDLRQMLQDGVDTSGVRFTGNFDDVVVLPYSSGTTGLPKGVMLSHRNIVSNLAQTNDRHEIRVSDPALGSHQDVVPAVLPLYHLYGLVIVLLGKLALGCKVVTLPKFDAKSFFKLLDQHQVQISGVRARLVYVDTVQGGWSLKSAGERWKENQVRANRKCEHKIREQHMVKLHVHTNHSCPEDGGSILIRTVGIQATVLYAAPPLLLFLASHPGVLPKYLQSLRQVMCGAAPLGGLDTERFLKRTPPSTDVFQAYGMTETSPSITQMVKGAKKYESVGGPIPNTEMKVVDLETGNSLAARQTGEICMRGPQVMRGYFNRPGDTAEIIDSEGWLHTGDLGYHDEEGHFYVVDRLKELIKVKGFQVAPAELEEILRSHPDIDEAAVVGVPDDRAGEVPRAFVVPARPGVSEEDIKRFVAAKVSEHKQLKGGVQFLSSIPKSPSGKILRRELKGVL